MLPNCTEEAKKILEREEKPKRFLSELPADASQIKVFPILPSLLREISLFIIPFAASCSFYKVLPISSL
jgi:hypothetical protein